MFRCFAYTCMFQFTDLSCVIRQSKQTLSCLKDMQHNRFQPINNIKFKIGFLMDICWNELQNYVLMWFLVQKMCKPLFWIIQIVNCLFVHLYVKFGCKSLKLNMIHGIIFVNLMKNIWFKEEIVSLYTCNILNSISVYTCICYTVHMLLFQFTQVLISFSRCINRTINWIFK